MKNENITTPIKSGRKWNRYPNKIKNQYAWGKWTHNIVSVYYSNSEYCNHRQGMCSRTHPTVECILTLHDKRYYFVSEIELCYRTLKKGSKPCEGFSRKWNMWFVIPSFILIDLYIYTICLIGNNNIRDTDIQTVLKRKGSWLSVNRKYQLK